MNFLSNIDKIIELEVQKALKVVLENRETSGSEERERQKKAATDLEKRNPTIAKLLSELPSNEFLATEAMNDFPVVIGNSGLDVEGDANRNDINDSSVKVFVGKGKSKGMVNILSWIAS